MIAYTTRQINFRVTDPATGTRAYRLFPADTGVYATRTSAGYIVRLPGNLGSAVTDLSAVAQ
jgi:hypothetical protein